MGKLILLSISPHPSPYFPILIVIIFQFIKKENEREGFELIVLVEFGVLGTYVDVAQGTVGIMD